jgi:hypothetical protein
MKIEIEHLQHLLEQARTRLTRDFEYWYVNVYNKNDQVRNTAIEPEDEIAPSAEKSLDESLHNLAQHKTSRPPSSLGTSRNANISSTSEGHPSIQHTSTQNLESSFQATSNPAAKSYFPPRLGSGNPLLKLHGRHPSGSSTTTLVLSETNLNPNNSSSILHSHNSASVIGGGSDSLSSAVKPAWPDLDNTSSTLNSPKIPQQANSRPATPQISSLRPLSASSKPSPVSVNQEIEAFYKARDNLLKKTASPSSLENLKTPPPLDAESTSPFPTSLPKSTPGFIERLIAKRGGAI